MAGNQGFTQTYERLVLDTVFGAGATPTMTGPPATWYVGLFTVMPTETTAGTEVSTSGTAYARIGVTNNNTNFPAASSAGPATKANGTTITYASAPTANWGTIVGFGFFTLSSGGTLAAFGALTTSKVVSSGDSAPVFAVGALVISQD